MDINQVVQDTAAGEGAGGLYAASLAVGIHCHLVADLPPSILCKELFSISLTVCHCSLTLHVGLPVFLYGESMGGLLALLYALQEPALPSLSGLILGGVVIKVAPSVLPPTFVVSVLRVLSKLFPRLVGTASPCS